MILCGSMLLGIGTAQTLGLVERKVMDRVAPTYPDLARRTHLSGVVKLEVVVRPNGTVKSVKPVGGNPVLIDAATAAVSKWRFEAGPVDTAEVVELSFKSN